MEIYEVIVGNGARQYFADKADAAFYAQDTREAGFSVRMQPIKVPQSARAFAEFMEGIERDIRPLRNAIGNCDRLHG